MQSWPRICIKRLDHPAARGVHGRPFHVIKDFVAVSVPGSATKSLITRVSGCACGGSDDNGCHSDEGYDDEGGDDQRGLVVAGPGWGCLSGTVILGDQGLCCRSGHENWNKVPDHVGLAGA